MVNKTAHILVIDDNRMNRIKLARGIEHDGHTVQTVGSAEEALNRFADTQFDLIFLNLIMSSTDGLELLKTIKSDNELRDYPLIMIIPQHEMSKWPECQALGAVNYLPPLFDAATLKETLDTYLQLDKPTLNLATHVLILVVDDDQVNRLKLSHSLEGRGYVVRLAENGEEALAMAEETIYDLILLDIMMPGIDGFETCRRLKANRKTAETPVLFMTALTATEDKLKGFEVGAVDYITKPIQQEELLARVNTHLRLRGLNQIMEEAYEREQERRQLSETLREVAKIVSSTLQQKQVLNLILEQLDNVVTYHWATITLKEENTLRLVAGYNKSDTPIEPFTIPIDRYPLNKQALEKGGPVLVRDVNTDPRWHPDTSKTAIKSFINAPLLVQGEPIGLLAVGRNDSVTYTQDEAQTVFAFAVQVAIAVKNANLAEQTRQALRETEGLFKGAQAILGSTQLHEICKNLAKQLQNLVQANHVIIFLIDQQEREITLALSHGELASSVTDLTYQQLKENLSGQVLQTKKPLLSLHTADHAEPTQLQLHHDVGSVIVLPLIARGRVIGTATVANTMEQRKFGEHDVDLLMALAAQAATAIDNVRLFNLAQQELIERKQAEEALQKANSELRLLNQDKDKFFSILAHDLKGPFMPLLGLSELLYQDAESFSLEEITDISFSIHRSTRRIASLLESLLQWARLQMGRIKYTPTCTKLQDIITRNTELLSENASYKNITLSDKTEAFNIYVDDNMIDTVIRNLVSNAIKFTPDGGQVTIQTETTPQPASNTTKMIKIAVTDTGVGIAEQDIEKLFRLDVHHSTPGTANEGGTGLGLIMCKEMVEKNGGDIWVESVKDEGTTFTFTVPLCDPENYQQQG